MKRCPAKLGRLLVANKLDAATRNKIQKQTFERRAACVTLGSLLTVGHREDLWGYAGFSVLKSEVDALKQPRKDEQEESMISAAAFARSVGMRREGWFEKLMAAGLMTGTRMLHPKIGGMRVYVSKKDIVEFHARFVTASTMEREFGLHRRTLFAKLKAAHVKVFAPNTQDFGALYLREDVEAVIKPARIVSRKQGL
jgi:hypothetical protein